MIKANKQSIALILCIAAFLFLATVLVRPPVPELPAYVSSSAAPNGVKALYELLEQQGKAVKAWRSPWQTLPSRPGQTLLVFEPKAAISDKEKTMLRAWLEQGNHLVLVQEHPSDWEPFELHHIGKSEIAKDVPVPLTRLQPSEEAGYTGTVAGNYRLETRAGLQALWKDERGVLAGRLPVGAGSMTVVLTPEWVKNGSILQYSHFQLLWPQVMAAASSSSAVWFDDYHHGEMEKPGLLAVFPGWLQLGLLQAGVAALLFLWAKAVRFGPAYTPRAWTVRRGDETLLAAAGWYERRRQAYDALLHQQRYVRQLMRERWGLRTDATDSQMLLAAKQRWDAASVERLALLLQAWNIAGETAVYTSARLEKDSRLADDVIRKLEKE